MSAYTITVRIYQTDVSNPFRVVEKTVWNYANGGTWDENQGAHVLKMNGSGTSGILRLLTFAFGVHNYKRWGDIVTGLANGDTATIIQAQYYQDDKGQGRHAAREAQRADYSVKSAKGRNYSIKYTVADGENLVANIIVG
ncbi:fungal fruit body lectin [Auriculariales sp. MPI-PUGE-AT-0066]|nr:fungal fruit body lectin [Auriculariales sp. MPI-PUGE-AT-0066]